MANALYGVNQGQTETDVTYSATSVTADVKVTIDLTKYPSNLAGAKEDILKALLYIQNYIIKDQDNIFG